MCNEDLQLLFETFVWQGEYLTKYNLWLHYAVCSAINFTVIGL
jgi:hypothetical protein